VVSDAHVKDEDGIDAQAICWLLHSSRDDIVLVAALQALAGLPRDFTAVEILHKADVIHRIEGAFQSCFSVDSTITTRWHALNIDSAELFCRAWLKLATSNSSISWPTNLIEPLKLMEGMSLKCDAAAVASCIRAFSRPTRQNVWKLLDHLTRAVSLDFDLSLETQAVLIDTFIECIIKWEQPTAVVEETRLRAIPTLIHVIHLSNDMGVYSTGAAAALGLHILVMGLYDSLKLRSEAARRDSYCDVMLQSLSIVARSPRRYGIYDEPTQQVIMKELTDLALPILESPERFSHTTVVAMRKSLTALLLERQIGVGKIPDSTLSRVLQLSYPPTGLGRHQTPQYLRAILDILAASQEPNIVGFTMRILDHLINTTQIPVCVSFVSHGGLTTLSSFFRSDQGRIAIDSVRTVCAFINTMTTLYRQDLITNGGAGYVEFAEHCEATFRCGFFDAFCALVSSGKWRFSDFSSLGALVRLCRLSPSRRSWPQVIAALQNAENRYCDSEFYGPTLCHIEAMRQAVMGQRTVAPPTSSSDNAQSKDSKPLKTISRVLFVHNPS
jgi:hypothetical protein